jgi:putative cell wall-binding protein
MLAFVMVVALAVPGVAGAAASDAAMHPADTKVLGSLAVAEGASSGISIAELPDVGGTPATADPLLPGVIAGTLDFSTDAVDVYAIDVVDGNSVGITITGAGLGFNADVLLYAPGTTDIIATPAIAATVGDGFPKSFVERIDTTGTYYLAVAAASGGGDYTLSFAVGNWNADADSEIPGTAGTSPATDTIDRIADPDDVWAIEIGDGERLHAYLDSWAPSLTPELYLFGPDTTSILTAMPVAASVSGLDRVVYYDVPAGSGDDGTYYLDVRAAAGSGTYDLEWTVSAIPAGTWENVGDAVPLPASPVAVVLNSASNANNVYSLDLEAGERFDVSLLSPVDGDFDVYVYGPGATNVFADMPVAYANGFESPDSLVYDVPVSGTYYVEVRAFAGAGTGGLTWDVASTPTLGATQRIWGSNRYDTAVRVSRSAFAAGSCETVVLATGQAFPDALSGSGLAGAYGSPLLLTPTASLHAGTLAEIERLGAENVVIVGGSVAVNAAVETALKSEGLTVTRVKGDNRYETAAAVAREVVRLSGPRAEQPFFLVRGDAFADALSAAPIAYANGFPVLLTAVDSLPSATSAVIGDLGLDEAVIVGGNAAVSAGVESAVGRLSAVRTVHREAGLNRYETAAALAEYAVRMWWAENAYVGVATGMDFPDALGGGAAAGANGGVLLLTNPATLSGETGNYLKAARADVLTPKVYGGTAVVSDSVRVQMDAALK